jgi:hypothetical protein
MLTNEFCVRGKFWEKDPHTHSPPPPLSVVGVSNKLIFISIPLVCKASILSHFYNLLGRGLGPILFCFFINIIVHAVSTISIKTHPIIHASIVYFTTCIYLIISLSSIIIITILKEN